MLFKSICHSSSITLSYTHTQSMFVPRLYLYLCEDLHWQWSLPPNPNPDNHNLFPRPNPASKFNLKTKSQLSNCLSQVVMTSQESMCRGPQPVACAGTHTRDRHSDVPVKEWTKNQKEAWHTEKKLVSHCTCQTSHLQGSCRIQQLRLVLSLVVLLDTMRTPV